MMGVGTVASLERLFLALGDKTRLKLLCLMAKGPVAVGLLADTLGESQPKVSRHLAYMREHGCVTTRRDGKWIHYGIAEPSDEAEREILNAVIGSMTGIPPTFVERGETVARLVDQEPPVRKSIIEDEKDISGEVSLPNFAEQYSEETASSHLEFEHSVNSEQNDDGRSDEIDVFLL